MHFIIIPAPKPVIKFNDADCNIFCYVNIRNINVKKTYS